MFVISKKIIHETVLYILLFMILLQMYYNVIGRSYSLQLGHLSFFIIQIISVYYLVKSLLNKERKPVFYKVWLFLLGINTFGFIFTADYYFSGHLGQLFNILLVSMPFFPFYYLSQKGILKSKHLVLFFVLSLILAILDYYYSTFIKMSLRNINAEDIVSNVAYKFVFLIPYLFLFKRKKIMSMTFAAIIMVFIIKGSKRGAMIAGVIGLLIFAYFQFRNIDRRHRITGYFITAICIVLISYFGVVYFLQNEFMVERMYSISEGNTSSRDIIYSNLFNSWINSDNILNIMFGFGFGQTFFHTGTGHLAHNDWLELLINFGVFGVLTYLTLFISLSKLLFGRRWNIDKKLMLLSILGIWFFTTLVSMNYTNPNSLFQTIILGFIVGSKSPKI